MSWLCGAALVCHLDELQDALLLCAGADHGSTALSAAVGLETVRKVSDAPATYPYGTPKWYFSARFGLCIPAKSTVEALLLPLFGQFLRYVPGDRASGDVDSRELSFRHTILGNPVSGV